MTGRCDNKLHNKYNAREYEVILNIRFLED